MKINLAYDLNSSYAGYASKNKRRNEIKNMKKNKTTTTTTSAANNGIAPIKSAICVIEMATAPSEAKRLASLRALMAQLETPAAMKAVARCIVSNRYDSRDLGNLFIPWAMVYKALAIKA